MSEDKNVNDVLTLGETEIEKTLLLLEQFADAIKKSKIQEKVVLALFSKHLKINQKNLKYLIDTVKSGKLRRELLKPVESY